jgi:hypothetical protein
MRPRRRNTVTATSAGDSHDSEPHCLLVVLLAAAAEVVEPPAWRGRYWGSTAV